MSISPISNALITMDTYASCIPIVATAVNLIDIALKSVLSVVSKKIEIKNRYLKYVSNKSYKKCAILLVPFVAQIYLLINHVKANNLFKAALGATDEREAFRLYSEAARRGHITAKFRLTECYLEGKGTEKNESLAVTYLQEFVVERPSYTESFLLLGKCYAQGRGVTKNLEEAFKLFTQSAQFNSPEGLFQLGVCYEYGLGVSKDLQQASIHYRKAADLGHTDAFNAVHHFMEDTGFFKNKAKAFVYLKNIVDANPNYCHGHGLHLLGRAYEEGWGVEKDLSKAVSFFRRAAALDNPYSLFALGRCYLHGLEVTQDKEQAFQFFQKAVKADPSYHIGIHQLAWCYENGVGVARNWDEALKLYKKAAELGYPKAMYRLADHYLSESPDKDLNKGFQFVQQAVEADPNYAEAINMLGRCHDEGWGVEKNSANALPHFLKAASLGSATAMFNAANYYLFSENPDKDLNRGFQFVQQAVEANPTDAKAINMLGRCYDEGWGVTQNLEEAAKLYKKAADAGHATAMYHFGLCLKQGLGVPENAALAREFFEKAAQLGHTEAQQELQT